MNPRAPNPGLGPWSAGGPSISRGLFLSGDMLKQDLQTLSLQHLTCSAAGNVASQVRECMRTAMPGETILDLLTRCISTLLYEPSTFFGSLITFCYDVIVNAPPFVTTVVIPLLILYHIYRAVQWVMQDYQDFLDCGRGGTPSTFPGWVKVTLKKVFANVNVLDPPHVDPMLEPYRGILFDIPRREGPRPVVKGVAPQRQFDQKTPVGTFDKLMKMLKEKAAKNSKFKVQTSYLEKYTDALKATCPDREHRVCGTEGEWDFELCHPHRNDGSLHMIMHPEDVKTVIEKGWGQRHPLATKTWYWVFWHHHILRIRLPVPYNLILIYAPRNQADFDMIEQFMDAAIWFATEKDACDQIREGRAGRAPCGTLFRRAEALASGRFIVGPDNRLLNHEKALDTGYWTWSSCGTKLIPYTGP